MADTYHFYKEGYNVPYDAFGHVVLRKHLDVPAIIASGAAGYSPLAVSGVRTALPSTGFGVGDVLNLFRVPAGFLVLFGGVRVTTAGSSGTDLDVGAVTAAEVATSAEAGYWLDAAAVDVVGYFPFDGSTGTDWSPAETEYNLYITNGSIDLTFNSAADKALIADIFVVGCKVF